MVYFSTKPTNRLLRLVTSSFLQDFVTARCRFVMSIFIRKNYSTLLAGQNQWLFFRGQ